MSKSKDIYNNQKQLFVSLKAGRIKGHSQTKYVMERDHSYAKPFFFLPSYPALLFVFKTKSLISEGLPKDKECFCSLSYSPDRVNINFSSDLAKF